MSAGAGIEVRGESLLWVVLLCFLYLVKQARNFVLLYKNGLTKKLDSANLELVITNNNKSDIYIVMGRGCYIYVISN